MSKRNLARAIARVYLKRAAEEAAYTVSREWDQKQKVWRDKMEGHIERWTSTYNNNVDKIDKIDNNIEKLEVRLKEAKGKAYIAKLKTWIEEENIRLEDISRKNSELAKKIHEVEKTLSSGSKEPWYYRDSSYGHRSFVSFGVSTGLRLTRREIARRNVVSSSASTTPKDDSPPRQQSFLEMLLGL